jgi:hypothetical protein
MIFERYSKHKKALFGIYFTVLIFGIALLLWREIPEKDSEYQKPAEVSDGFGNNQIAPAIEAYLLTQKSFNWKTGEGSKNFCVVQNLMPEKELFPLYIYARCGEFIKENGQIKEISGMSGPIKINYPNELSFYDTAKFTHEAPRDGSLYGEDTKRIFPKEVVERIAGFDNKGLVESLNARAQREIR